MKFFSGVFWWVLIPVVSLSFLFHAINLGKDLSYKFFYRTLVRETIREMVKNDALNILEK